MTSKKHAYLEINLKIASKKILFVALLLAACTVGFAQNAKLIIGKWAYVDLYDKSAIDEQGQQMMTMLFGQMTISFGPDNTMLLAMRKKPEVGTYAFDKTNDTLLTATSATGKQMNFTIVKLNEKELIFTMGDAGTMVMKKVSDTPDAPPAVTPKVSATMNQISGKWHVMGKEDQKSEFTTELLKGSFVDFGADGKYNAKILAIEQSGTWKFGEGNTTIIVDMGEDGKGVWSIYAISDSDLLMQNDTSSVKIKFSRNAN
jgi:hypothetical protein